MMWVNVYPRWVKASVCQADYIWYCAMTLWKDRDMWFLRSTVRMQDCHFCDKGSTPLGTATHNMRYKMGYFGEWLDEDWLVPEINNNKNR